MHLTFSKSARCITAWRNCTLQWNDDVIGQCQWFSTGIFRNTRVPPMHSKGSARSRINAINRQQFEFSCADMWTGVPRATRMLPYGSAPTKRQKNNCSMPFPNTTQQERLWLGFWELKVTKHDILLFCLSICLYISQPTMRYTNNIVKCQIYVQ